MTDKVQEIDEAAYQAMQKFCADGDALAANGEFAAAIAQYNQAWQLVPEPKTEWKASTWILTAVGDAYFYQANFTGLRSVLEYAMHCPGAIGNPFMHLRLGQAQFELGELDKAADELMRAYMGAGEDIFQEDDPKYFAFLKTRAAI